MFFYICSNIKKFKKKSPDEYKNIHFLMKPINNFIALISSTVPFAEIFLSDLIFVRKKLRARKIGWHYGTRQKAFAIVITKSAFIEAKNHFSK